MSRTACMHSIVAALMAAEGILGPDRTWGTSNANQERFVRDFLPRIKSDLPQITDLIKSTASFSADEINAFLALHGFPGLRVEPFSPDRFGAVGILDALVKWIKAGTLVDIVTPGRGQRYPGVKIDKYGVSFCRHSSHRHPVVAITTQTQDIVYLTMHDDLTQASVFDLFSSAERLSHDLSQIWEFGSLHFPMVKIDQSEDISWLEGLSTLRQDTAFLVWVEKALQQNRLKMNQFGARAQSATVLVVRSLGIEMPKPPHIINQPFLVWFTRRGLSLPYFVAYVDESDWKNPGNLEG